MGFTQVSRPSSAFGYTRGTQYYRGSGSGIGDNVGGTGVFSAGQGTSNGTMANDWTPDIGYLFILLIIQMAVFGWLSRKI